MTTVLLVGDSTTAAESLPQLQVNALQELQKLSNSDELFALLHDDIPAVKISCLVRQLLCVINRLLPPHDPVMTEQQLANPSYGAGRSLNASNCSGTEGGRSAGESTTNVVVSNSASWSGVHSISPNDMVLEHVQQLQHRVEYSFFLCTTLPLLIDALLRRKTSR